MAKINSLALHATLLMAIFAITINNSQAEDSPAIKILLSRAQTQAQSGHLNIAISTWQQVLAADPANIEALRSIATAEVQLGHQPEANAYIQRLQKAGASRNVIEQLQSMHARPSDAALLQQASAMAKSGQYSGAMEIYQKLYGNDPPAGATALTYYDTLAALPAERKRAVEGLRKLARQFPSDERYSIALGRVLTYDASTRAEGMALLQRYPTDRSADDALKQAMIWSERIQTPGDATTAIPNHIAVPQTATTSELGAGYRALNARKLSEAEEHFNKALAHEVTHGQAHAGLGYVRMQQKEFGDAVREFEQAKDGGDHDANLTQSLATSRFWNFMGEAQGALDNKDWNSSIASYRSALALKPDNPDALAAVGGTLMRAARPKEAVPYLQRALRVNAGSQAVWRSLFLAQSQSSQQADALKTAENIPANIRIQLEADPEFMGSLAVDYAAVGDQSRSDSTLKRALALLQADGNDGSSVANQMQYASLLLTAKRYNTAVRSYRRILTVTPDNSDAWRGMITADHLAGRDDEALRAFRQVPPTISIAMLKDANFLAMLAGIYQSQGQIEASRTTLERALKIAPSTALKLQLASLEMSGGDKPYATEMYAQIVDEHPDSTEAWLGWLQSLHATNHDRDALRQIEEMPENVNSALTQNPDYLQTLASVYGALGDRRRATEAIAEVDDYYSQQGIDPPAAVRLQQGWLLLQSGDNTKFSRIIKQLSQTDDLTEDQQSQVARLWASWAIQRASQLSRLGHPAASIEILAAALRTFPNDVSLNNALANAYLASGDPKRSVALYARQDMTQADASVCVSAINAALSANDRKQARLWLQTSLDRFERDPKVLELAARFEQQRGDLHRAAAYDRAALRAAGSSSIAELTSTSDIAPGTSAVSSRQQLFNLLAPTNAESSATRRSHSRDDLDRDVAQDALSTRPDTNHSKGTFAHLKNGRSENDLSLPPLEKDITQGQERDISRVPPSTRLDTSDEDADFPILPRKKSTVASTLPSRKRQVIAEQDTTSAPAIDHSPIDLPDAVTSIPPYPNTSRYRKGLSASPEPLDPVLSDIPAFEVHGRADRQAYDEPSSTIYKNATLKRIVAHNELEDVSTDDAPTSSAMLEPLPVGSVEPLPPLTGSTYVVKQPLTPRQQTQQNLEAIESSSSPYVGGDSSVNLHSGQPGFDRLTIFGAAVEQSMMIGGAARATFVVRPTLLQSGTATADASYQMGTLPLGALTNIQTAAGVGGEVQLRTRSLGAAVGYSPRGFLVENITGRLMIQPDNGPVTLSFERQPIEETQLSYAGLRDFGSITSSNPGNIWGGVISNAGSVLINHSDATSGWYLQGGGQYITGKHVETNHRLDGYAGAYWAIWNHPEYGKLTLGMNFFGMHYANNQRLFTYGNGGYFSPGAYLLSSVPISFEGIYGSRFHYRAAGSVGLQALEEDASPYYPIDSALQAAAKNPYTVERISVGANYNVDMEGSYLITDHWHVGGFFSANNAYDYTSDKLGFFLRYAFKPQSLDSIGGPTGLGVGGRGLRPLFTR